MDHNYRIVYKIGNSSFEIESTDKMWFDQKEMEYLEKLKANPSFIPKSKEESFDSRKIVPQNVTINEFYRNILTQNKIQSRPDIAVFFIYYLAKITKKDVIKSADIQQCFADISYPNYNKLNFADILNKAKKKAFLNYVNGVWSLTLTGEDYVLSTISKTEE